MGKCILDFLRYDVWEIVFEFLDTYSFYLNVACVCKRFKELVKKHYLKVSHLNYHYDIYSEKLKHDLNFTFETIFMENIFLDTLFPLSQFKQKKLKFFLNTESSIYFYNLPCLSTLICLEISSQERIIKELLEMSFLYLKTLKVTFLDRNRMNITQNVVDFLKRHEIEKLKITSYRFATKKSFTDLLNNYPSLKSIDLSISYENFLEEFNRDDLVSFKIPYYMVKLPKIAKILGPNLRKFSFCICKKNNALAKSLSYNKIQNLAIVVNNDEYSHFSIPIKFGSFLKKLKITFSYNNFLEISEINNLILQNHALENLILDKDITEFRIDDREKFLVEILFENKRKFTYNNLEIGFSQDRFINLETVEVNGFSYSNFLACYRYLLLNSGICPNEFSNLVIKNSKVTEKIVNLSQYLESSICEENYLKIYLEKISKKINI